MVQNANLTELKQILVVRSDKPDQVYGIHLVVGDVIIARSPGHMDSRRKAEEAVVLSIEKTLDDAKNHVAELDILSRVGLTQKNRRAKNTSPSKRKSDQAFLDEVAGSPKKTVVEADESTWPPEWKWHPETGRQRGVKTVAVTRESAEIAEAAKSNETVMHQIPSEGAQGSTSQIARQNNESSGHMTEGMGLEATTTSNSTAGKETPTPPSKSPRRPINRVPAKKSDKDRKSSGSKKPFLSFANPSTAQKATKISGLTQKIQTGPLSRRTQEQLEMEREVKKELNFKDGSKTELFKGSCRYVSTTRFNNFLKHPHQSPVVDAVNLAIIIFGTQETMMKLFTGDRYGLNHALGDDVVSDICGEKVPVTPSDLNKAFSRKMTYFRNAEGAKKVISSRVVTINPDVEEEAHAEGLNSEEDDASETD